jgi:hypothetical protein
VPDERPIVGRVAAALRVWEASEEGPTKLVYPLAHRYTQAELCFAALKNEDGAAADVLEPAAKAAGQVLRLAMVHIWEAGFLEDPGSKEWQLRALQADRSHVEHMIEAAKVDLSCRTERRGRPHTLVCTKNQASYESRVRQGQADLAALRQLEG